jgi:hypothetical protein
MHDKLILAMLIVWLLFMLWDRGNQAKGIADFQRRVFEHGQLI